MTSDATKWYLLDSVDASRVSSCANARCTSFARVVDSDAIAICRYECIVLHAEGNCLSDSRRTVTHVQRGHSVQKATADRHSQHLLLV